MPPYSPNASGGPPPYGKSWAMNVGQIPSQSPQQLVTNQVPPEQMSSQTVQYQSNPLRESITSQLQENNEHGQSQDLQKPFQDQPSLPQQQNAKQTLEKVSEQSIRCEPKKVQRENKRKSRWDSEPEQNKGEEQSAKENVKPSEHASGISQGVSMFLLIMVIHFLLLKMVMHLQLPLRDCMLGMQTTLKMQCRKQFCGNRRQLGQWWLRRLTCLHG